MHVSEDDDMELPGALLSNDPRRQMRNLRKGERKMKTPGRKPLDGKQRMTISLDGETTEVLDRIIELYGRANRSDGIRWALRVIGKKLPER